MVEFIIFINLFFVPMLALYMIYQRKGKPLIFNVEMLLQYCIIAACNIPFTEVFTLIFKKISGNVIPLDSGYYTLFALFSAVLLYKYYVSGLYEKYSAMFFAMCGKLCTFGIKQYARYRKACFSFYKEQSAYYSAYLKKSLWREKIAGRGIKRIIKELLPAYFVLLAACFMMFIYEPILLYSTNKNDFWFDFGIMITPLLGVFAFFLLIGIAAMSVIYFINLFFSGRLIVYKIMTLAFFISFFLLYLQGNFLSGKLPTLTGEKIIWGNYGKTENVILITALIILVIAAIILVRKVKLDRTLFHASAGASLVSFILIVALISTMMKNDAFINKDTFSATTKNFNDISSNKNFLIFLVDTVDSKAFYDVMSQDEDFKEMFEDFTYYPDTLSVYPYTFYSVPQILSGILYYRKTTYLDYSSSAYNSSSFFRNLKKNQYAINLYSHAINWSGSRNFNIENATSIRDIKVNFNNFKKQVWRYVRFKYLPYGYKQYSHIEAMDFNLCKINREKKIEYYSVDNKIVYDLILKNPTLTKRNQNLFQFVHIFGAHPLFDMDKFLVRIVNGTYENKVAASLTIIKAYLQRLKANNAYDNSVIVIMADHGISVIKYNDTEKSRLARLNPPLLIKGFKEKHNMIVSDYPVSYMDLQQVFSDLINGRKSTELFADTLCGRERTVFLYENALPIIEYTTTGKAWEIEKFTPTGNEYISKE